jgi:hypothetical protein
MIKINEFKLLKIIIRMKWKNNKFQKKIIEGGKIDIPNSQIHDRSVTFLA